LLNLWLMKVILRCVNDGVTTIKPEYQTTRQMETRTWYSQMSRPSRCSLHQEEFTFGQHPRKPTIRNAWLEQWNTGEVLWWSGQQHRGKYSPCPIITLHGRITAREYVDRWGNQAHSMISEERCSFPRRQCPYSHSWNCSVIVRRVWKWTSTSSLASSITRSEHHWTTLVWKTRVRNRFSPSTSLKQHEDVLQEEWYKIPLQTV
jgi:hypothetical protein